MKAQRGSTGTAILCVLTLAQMGVWGWVVNTMPWLLDPQEGELVPIVQEAVWASGPAWMCAENPPPPNLIPGPPNP